MSVFKSPLVKKIISLSIEEDLAYGDVTSELTVPKERRGVGEIIAKENMVVCGLPLIEMVTGLVSDHVKSITLLKSEGERARKGEVLARIDADLRGLLGAERTILNFLQRLSGVATLTAQVCAQSRGLTILDTRKTTPGLRVLEKYAVRVGGGSNHRSSLGDMVLVKNNHIDANQGSVKRTMEHVARNAPPYMPVEIEVRNLVELADALPFNPSVIMLDNMNDREIKRALQLISSLDIAPQVEVSGGVTTERFKALTALGIKMVSMGALTTRAQNVDISMRISSKR
jgi:nicotinate-nucleotide pyrophosphorylase (carboxylating)